MRKISIFGATGSIGRNTVDVIERQGGPDAFNVVALSGGRNVAELASQARRLRADVAVTAFPDCAEELATLLADTDTRVLSGAAALIAVAQRPVDWAMSAIIGAAGLHPTIHMAQHARVLALANKECLVCAGAHLKAVCAANGTTLLPVDSEHSAIFQSLMGGKAHEMNRIILTASGGPFRTWSRDAMAAATLEQALTHPNWDMGAGITIDSASMFNKALEMIEAQVLFDAEPQQVEVIIHPQSIVHSMVGFRDGAIIAQLGPPDMRGAIGFALNYPDRQPLPVERLDFGAVARLDFETPDTDRFPALGLARQVMEMGGATGAVLNAAKEVAQSHFIAGRIGFLDMAAVVDEVLHNLADDAVAVNADDGIDPILMIDQRARGSAASVIAARFGQSEQKAMSWNS